MREREKRERWRERGRMRGGKREEREKCQRKKKSAPWLLEFIENYQ